MESQSQMRNDVDIQRNGYLEQVSSAMKEILRLGLVNALLWKRNMECGDETLKFIEYVKAFTPCLGIRPPGFVSEFTRASSVVPINGSMEMYVYVCDRKLYYNGSDSKCVGGSRSGDIQLMKANIQVISPLVPITWIEHDEHNEQSVPRQYRKLISSGFGFGEKDGLVHFCGTVRA
ncbi:homeobox-leucine zipper protein ROC5-like [Bidens hawaiensis]|uniref:homeobox-leucine zipper protein ROC5-like n=1 Tax=Bidens hawaiensis TaxID=980011 RepID=UPI0040493017